jgi:hypothetical protein
MRTNRVSVRSRPPSGSAGSLPSRRASRRGLLLLVLILTGCISEPAPSPLVPDGGASVGARLGDGLRFSDPVPTMHPVRPNLPSNPSRPVVPIPSPRLIVVQRLSGPTQPSRDHVRSGTASWYCGHGSPCTRGYPDGLYAAAGPALRQGRWRGRTVTVALGARRVRVTLIDWCACPSRLLDLYSSAFERLALLSHGLVNVGVSW